MAVSPDGGLYPCDLFYWFDKNRLGDIWNGVDEKALKEYLSQVESVENIDSSCIAEHLYYRH
jgi:radical SAM protein with 4Fe4S-binding SPASM domain